MSFNKSTNVTNTGLGDDQYAQLQGNQSGLGSQIEEGFSGASTALGTISANTSGLSGDISGVKSDVGSGFTNLNDLLTTYGDSLTQGQTDALGNRQTNYANLITALQNNTGGLATQASLDTGFNNATGRFDTLDSSVGNVQGTVDQVSTDLGVAQSTLDDGFATASGRFDNLDAGQTGISDAATVNADALGNQLTDTQANTLAGQGLLGDSLATMSDTADAYASTITGNQDTMIGNQDTFVSDFDSYVDRYGDDTEIAQQARSDLADAQSSQTDALRNDLGLFAQAAAQGQTNIQNKLGNLGEGTTAGFTQLEGAIGSGFSNASTEDQLSQQNLSIRMGNIKDLIQTSGDNLDASTKAQYTQLANAFDENGSLIANSIDEQGNTITRSMDDQGTILEQKIDGNGNVIDAVSMDVGTMLGEAEAYEQSIMGQMDSRFDQQDANASANLKAIGQGFNTQDKKLDMQTRDLSRVASEQSDLDVNMRNEFRQLSNAFDDQGNLISNSIMDNGTSISRSVDDQGNLLLRQFDATGNRMGDQVLNINQSLNRLSQLSTFQGSNSSMGQLSPANTASSSGNQGFASSGFASTQ